MPSDTVIMTAIIAVAALEVVALCFGYNGTLLALAVAAIAGLGGYNLRIAVERVRHHGR